MHMVPGFPLADTNPKAVGIFCLLLLLASRSCRGLRSAVCFPVTHTYAKLDEHTLQTINTLTGVCADATTQKKCATNSVSALLATKLAHLLDCYC